MFITKEEIEKDTNKNIKIIRDYLRNKHNIELDLEDSEMCSCSSVCEDYEICDNTYNIDDIYGDIIEKSKNFKIVDDYSSGTTLKGLSILYKKGDTISIMTICLYFENRLRGIKTK